VTEQNYDFSKPGYFGILPKELFDEIDSIFAGSVDKNRSIKWVIGDEEKYRREPLLRTMTYVTENLLALYHTDDAPVKTLVYTFDVHDVQPQRFQRMPTWHQDYLQLDARGILTAASSNPTEFIVTSPAASLNHEELTEFIDTNAYDTVRGGFRRESTIQEGIRHGIFDIYQPQPYEGVTMLRHFHKSPLNESNQIVKRTWMRATLYGMNLDEVTPDDLA
jgi:hypothetical protein